MNPRNKKRKILSQTSEWTFELLERYDHEIARLAKQYGLNTFPNQIQVITSEQMLDAYASIGMPINYAHWSFGKKFLEVEKGYRRGQMGLAYEMVINSNPCIAYLMEENSMALQAIVIAHACYGHNSFFKNNYLFKTWTNPESIIDYLVFSKKYISDCEEQFGVNAVEEILDAAHALMNYGVDRYRHPRKLSLEKERQRQQDHEAYLQSQVNELWKTIPKSKVKEEFNKERFLNEPQENILLFVEKHSPGLETWQREIVRIVRKMAQYFYPQRQTRLMNEGWATFWHYTLINDLYDEGYLTDEFMLEFLQIHTGVIYQPPFDSHYYTGINPYHLGFSIYKDIQRICQNPTDEDKQWFPDLINKDWRQILNFAMCNFKDESFIAQYLSPKTIRDLKLFAVVDDDKNHDLIVSAIHNNQGYQMIRQTLSNQYNLSYVEPNIQIYDYNYRGDHALLLRHIPHENRPLNSETDKVLGYLHRLWGFTVRLESLDEKGMVQKVYQYPI